MRNMAVISGIPSCKCILRVASKGGKPVGEILKTLICLFMA
jgi:hypothetical protein